MAYRESRACLSCGAALMAELRGGTSIERCGRCGGIWIREDEFLQLLRASPTAQHPDELMEHNDGSPRRPCPVCFQTMNLAWIDFLKLDRCPAHGVWLDPGEMRQALRSRGAWSAEVSELVKRLFDPDKTNDRGDPF